MTKSDTRGAPTQEAKLPSMSPSLSRQSDGHAPLSNQRHQQRSPPMLPSSSSATASSALPPPPRLHLYRHPISASYASSSSSYYDPSRQPPPPLWKERRSPPLEHRSSDGSSSSFSSRVLPPLSTSSSSNGSSASAFQLPSLSASLPSSTSWHGRESSHASGLNGTHTSAFRASREVLAAEARRTAQDSKLASLSSGQFADYHASRQSQAEPSPAAIVSPSADDPSQAGRKPAKAHVPSACLNCKRAHLACDVGRPCRRCVNLGKSDTCIDVQHKKRGRPRLKARPSSQAGIATLQSLEGKRDVSGSPASASYARQSPGSEQGYFRSSTRNNELLSPPVLSSSAVMQVAGRTHGPGAHPRSASNSVSASSYPYSRPDHIRHPSDASSYGGAYPTPFWSYHHQQQQQNGSHGQSAHPMGQRQHSHSLSYEQSYQQHQHASQQHSQVHLSSQPLASMHLAGSAGDAVDSVVSAVVTMICSTNLQCARVSDECSALLGYQPSELNERSLFELVHPSETSRLQDIWTSLIDPVGVVPQTVPAAAEIVMSTPSARLMTPAAGTIFVQENMRLRQRNGMYDFYSVRLHLGGGFGIDLYRRETLDRAYIVASLLKLGNDAVHPDPSILRSLYSHDSSQSQGFRTPSAPQSAAAAAAPTAPAPNRNGHREDADTRASHQHEQEYRPRSESVNQRSAHFESQARRGNEAMHSSKEDADRSPQQERSRGVKRSSAQMDQDESNATSSRSAPSSQMAPPLTGAATVSNTSSYSASKHAAYSPSPVVHSLLSKRTQDTSRDGILC